MVSVQPSQSVRNQVGIVEKVVFCEINEVEQRASKYEEISDEQSITKSHLNLRSSLQ